MEMHLYTLFWLHKINIAGPDRNGISCNDFIQSTSENKLNALDFMVAATL
jgi:hypothetical protein